MTSRKTYGNRKFFALPEDYPLRGSRTRSLNGTRKSEDTTKLIRYIDENVIGKHTTFFGPYGRRKVVYCDYTASARALQFIEDYILKDVLPCYGNTHTATSITSLQSSLYRHEARDIFRNAVNASEHDAVIFAGHGCTGAIHKLINGLNLMEPPVVFVGPWEHHSNLLPWREIGAKIVRVAETRDGFLDLKDLENQLQAHHSRNRQLIGCFSAASNITGTLADDIGITLLLHQYGALAFWDYATAAPYVKLDMNPYVSGTDEKAAYKDAMFFSVHKFIGGVQTPGVLIAKKSLFRNPTPNGCGGGSVFFVTRDDHRYLQDVELREEGGTGAIVESVRAGMVMQLKETVTPQAIMAREEKICSTVLSHIKTIPELILLGSTSGSVQRLPVFSFVVRHPRGTFLHHNFVCTVLNDVFGIQARGGCACAGPYAQDLLGIDEDLAEKYESVLLEDRRLDRTHLRRHEEHSSYEMLRPGFARISLPFFMSDNEMGFVLEALKMVATEGWKLLPQYIVNPETGEWRHHTNSIFRDRKWLGSIRYVDGKMTVNERRISGQGTFPQDYADSLHIARSIFNKARKMAQRYPLADQCVMFDEKTEPLRWFMLPSEAQDLLLGNSQRVKQEVPFNPVKYMGARGSVTQTPVDSAKTSPQTYRLFPGDLSRHNSLPCVTKQLLCLTPPPPLFTMMQSQPNLVTLEHQMVSPMSPDINSPLSFPVVDVIDSSSVISTGSPDMSETIVSDQTYGGRARCYSLGSAALSPPLIMSQDIFRINVGENSPRQRHFSYNSQIDLNDPDNNNSFPSLDLHLCNSPANGSPYEHFSSIDSTEHPEHLHNYVKEMTKELATEIKSEIRDVISKVEDVLSENESLSHQNFSHYDKYNAMRNDSVSATEVAEYLMEMSKEVASEMKSEIREMVSAVDVLMSPDAKSNTTPSSEAPLPAPNFTTTDVSYKRNSLPRVTENVQLDECSRDMDVTNIINFRRRLQNISSKSSEEGDEEVQYDSLENKHHYLRSTMNSVSSQDSGINLMFQDDPSANNNCVSKPDDGKMNYANRQKFLINEKESGCCSNTAVQKETTVEEKSSELCQNGKENNISDNKVCERRVRRPAVCDISSGVKWHSPPKGIWKPTLEALQEFEMIADGDRVMVCLSGGKDSLSLLHTLHQYQYYARSKGINFTLGAATVDPKSSAYDPSPLIPYLKALGVHYLYEEQDIIQQAADIENVSSICSFCSRMKRGRLYSAARANNYNVLALGQHLDDLSESFLMSVFHNGRLRTMKANYYVRERDLRVIRPFVYVREKALRQFAESKKLPIIPENCPACFEVPKERHRTKQLLAQQEILFPQLYWSLRSALHPLINFRYTGEESKVYSKQRKHSQINQMRENTSSDSEDEN